MYWSLEILGFEHLFDLQKIAKDLKRGTKGGLNPALSPPALQPLNPIQPLNLTQPPFDLAANIKDGIYQQQQQQ